MAIGINGLGRIGRLVLKDFFGGLNRKSNNKDISILHLNEPNCDAKTLCHLLKFDSIHGIWDASINQIGNKKISINVTDDIKLAKELGVQCSIVIGSEKNFKITTQLDFKLAKILLKDEI